MFAGNIPDIGIMKQINQYSTKQSNEWIYWTAVNQNDLEQPATQAIFIFWALVQLPPATQTNRQNCGEITNLSASLVSWILSLGSSLFILVLAAVQEQVSTIRNAALSSVVMFGVDRFQFLAALLRHVAWWLNDQDAGVFFNSQFCINKLLFNQPRQSNVAKQQDAPNLVQDSG